MTDAKETGEDLALAIWDAIADILHRKIHD
jgi:hypothetical protein